MSSPALLMSRRSFPSGQASAALLKAAWRSLQAQKPAGVTDAWLRATRMSRDDLEDETRILPLPAIHQGLMAFADATSRDAVTQLGPYLIEPDLLGVWVRVLRGTREPSEAFARLDSVDSDYGRTTRWETVASRRGYWHGRLTITHDPSVEEDGLMRMARVSELAAVPALFGWPDAVARICPDAPGRSATSVQDYEVEWRVPNPTMGVAVGAALGVAVGLLVVLIHPGSRSLDALVLVLASLIGSAVGAMRAFERLRRADTQAQALRVHALERSLSLRESREREVPGQLEGSVAAGQYRLVRRMGSGATGVIYEAVRITDGVPVAIKLLRAAAAHEAVASDRLRREAEALGLAWHPNVVEVLDHGRLPDGTAYLVMELLHGESLAARLLAKGHLAPNEVMPIALQICAALSAVHAAGVVHRDVKPSNVFVAGDSEGPNAPDHVKLLDFGIARVEWEETRITNTGGPLGTPGYMSPEQEVGSADIDGRSDLFSLGAILYECLVGEPPPTQSPSGLVRTGEGLAIRLEAYPLKASARIPPGWHAVIEKAMAQNPADRYQDARAFAQALRGIAEPLADCEASS